MSTKQLQSPSKSQEFSGPMFPKMGCHSPIYKRPMSYTPVKPKPTKQEQLSIDLGLEYDNNAGYGSLSSGDEENGLAHNEATTVLSVKYQALKRQMKQMSDERENHLLKISKLKEKTKSYERQLHTEESDRKNQLNIMKNTHDQIFNDKDRVIHLFESVVREQECELEELRKISHTEGLGTCVDYPTSQSGNAITRLTTQLDHIVQEKNDILAQFFSQQTLIKEQQSELKGLLRCKAENADLQAQLSALSKTNNNLNKQTDTQKDKLSQTETEVSKLRKEVQSLKLEAQTALSRHAVQKLEDQNTKLQDKLLRKEAELAELDFKHRERIQVLEDQSTDKEQQIRQLKMDVYEHKSRSQSVVEKIREVPVESEASKKHLSEAKLEIESLTKSNSRVKADHQRAVELLQSQHREVVAQLEKDLTTSRKDHEDFVGAFKNRDEQELKTQQSHQKAVDELETQLKQRRSEVSKLRQEMADRLVDLERKHDVELEEAETRLREGAASTTRENHELKERLRQTLPELSQLRIDCLQFRTLCQDLQRFNQAECASIATSLNRAIYDVNEHNKDLVRKYRGEMALRKKYHNELVELKGNIRVFCRIRPVIREDGASPSTALEVDADDEDVLWVRNSKGRSQRFDIDRLFTAEVSQPQVFDEVKALVTSCVDGYHVCIFAYGQTGSGKTYTMEGPRSDPGINQRALAQLFEEAADRSKDWTFNLQVSVMEIYNESVRDLLSTEPADKLDIKLNQEGNLHVPGLSWVTVNNVADVNSTFSIGHKNRATASTNMNEHSSRSHALLCVEVTGHNRTTGAKTLGRLNLVDLAGSERVSKSGADGARLKEAQAINKSLSALGDVIAALRSKQSFVPYRNSKLTYLLQDSLGGDSKVLMIVQVAPVENHVNETLCSLNFAQRVRSVELGMASKKMENAEITALKGRLAQYEGQSPLSTPTKSATPYGTPVRRK